MENINMIKPDIWKGEKSIWAGFTIKNKRTEVDEHVNRFGQPIVDIPDIESSKKALWKALKIDEKKVATARQIHSGNVTYVSHGGVYPDTDALVSDIPDLLLGIQVADCAAVLLADTKAGVIGAAHSGWRGTVGGVLSNTVSMMIRYGADPERLKVYVSPCICMKCFEVGEEVAELFSERDVYREGFKKPHVDLKAEIKYRLMNLEIQESNIELDPGCTMHESGRFYSYRRDHEHSGRMMGLIRLIDLTGN